MTEQDKDFREDLGIMLGRLGNLSQKLRTVFYELESCRCASPAEHKKRRLDSLTFEMLVEVVERLIFLSTPPDFKREGDDDYVRQRIKILSQNIDAIYAMDYLDAVDRPYLGSQPYTSCQVYFGHSNFGKVWHQGTGNQRGVGGSSGGRVCGGPIRTPEEMQLGMCGSCLQAYGSKLGRIPADHLNRYEGIKMELTWDGKYGTVVK